MLLHRLILASILASILVGGCTEIFPRGKGPGEPCVRSSECQTELSCRGGVCQDPGDASVSDGGSSDGG